MAVKRHVKVVLLRDNGSKLRTLDAADWTDSIERLVGAMWDVSDLMGEDFSVAWVEFGSNKYGIAVWKFGTLEPSLVR